MSSSQSDEANFLESLTNFTKEKAGDPCQAT
jgi:hypothetical protein